MTVTTEMVKDLREKTGAGIIDCKKALTETGGDIEKAVEYLRLKGIADASKKTGRSTSEGVVGAYIHSGGKIGVLIEVNCETDFVAKTEEFQELVKDLAMHIAAMNPRYLRREDVPQEVIEKEKMIYAAQAKEEGKPEKIIDRIVEGRLEKFFAENCLLEQAFVKDPEIRISELIAGKISATGENISIRRFTRYQLGVA